MLNRHRHNENVENQRPEEFKQILLEIPKPGERQLLTVRKCQSMATASAILSNNWFCKQRSPSVIAISLKTNEELDLTGFQRPLAKNYNKNSQIVISFEPKRAGDRLIYWKNKNDETFHELKILNVLGHSVELSNFIFEFFVKAFEQKYDVTINDNHLGSMVKSNGANLLMIATSGKNYNIMSELLKHSFDLDQKSNSHSRAIDFAWKKRDCKAIEMLLRANSMYPDQFDITQLQSGAEGIKKIIETTNTLHNAIKDEDVDKIEEILSQNQELSYFYDTSNVSAAAFAIKKGKHNIYRLLVRNNRYVGLSEKVDTIFKRLFRTLDGERARNVHADMSELYVDYIANVCSHCIVSFDDRNVAERKKLIYEALNDINNIKFVDKNGKNIEFGKILLSLVATYKNYKIYFEFNRSSLQALNPYDSSRDANGITNCTTGQIYIRAKELLNSQTRHKTVGILMHELSHLALQVVFRNESNPYGCDDNVRKTSFSKIIATIKQHKDKEDIVKRAFDCYDEKDWPSELIVRPAHMIGHYFKEPEKLPKLRKLYSGLFKYFENFIIPQMDKTLDLLTKLQQPECELTVNDLTPPLKKIVLEFPIIVQGKSMTFDRHRRLKICKLLKPMQIYKILNKSIEIIKIKDEEKIHDSSYIERDFIEHKAFSSRKRKCNLITEPEPESKRRKILNFNQLKAEADETRVIILADQAGAGKSTTFKHIYEKFNNKNENSDCWAEFVDLKQHLKLYEPLNNQQFNYPKVLNILEKMLNLTDEFEIEVFHQLFRSGNVILLLDGVDEIAPNFKDFFINLTKSIKKYSKNQLWISTRPQYSEELMKIFKQRSFKLKPWIKEKKTKYIEKIFMQNNVEKRRKKIEEFFKFIRSLTGENTIRNIDNPFMLKILVLHFIDDPELLRTSNRYEIYQHIFEAKKKELEDKNNNIATRERDKDGKLNIWQVHQVFAMKAMFFKKKFTDYFVNNEGMSDENVTGEEKNFVYLKNFILMKKWNRPVSRNKWTKDVIARYGFFYVNEKNTAVFQHRSYQEFFIAKFLIENIFEEENDEESDEEIERRMKLLLYLIKNNDGTIIFIKDYLKAENDPISNEKIVKFVRKRQMKDFLKEMLVEIIDEPEKIQIYMTLLELFLYDRAVVKELSLVDYEEGTSFKLLLQNSKELFPIFYLFEFFKSNDCLKFLGFGDLNFRPLTDEVIKIITEQIRDRDKTKILKCLCLYQLFQLFTENNIPTIYIQDFFINTMQEILQLILICPFLKNSFVKVLTKFVNNGANDIFSNAFPYILSNHTFVQNLPPDSIRRMKAFELNLLHFANEIIRAM